MRSAGPDAIRIPPRRRARSARRHQTPPPPPRLGPLPGHPARPPRRARGPRVRPAAAAPPAPCRPSARRRPRPGSAARSGTAAPRAPTARPPPHARRTPRPTAAIPRRPATAPRAPGEPHARRPPPRRAARASRRAAPSEGAPSGPSTSPRRPGAGRPFAFSARPAPSDDSTTPPAPHRLPDTARASRPPRPAPSLGLGLIGGAATGSWLTGDSAGAPADRPYAAAGTLWHSVPVDTLFPRTLKGDGAGPGGADRTWTRIAVAPDSGCEDAFDPLLRRRSPRRLRAPAARHLHRRHPQPRHHRRPGVHQGRRGRP